MKAMILIDALRVPEVLEGQKWVAITLDTEGQVLPMQTFRVDLLHNMMLWVDNNTEVAFHLRQLRGPCAVIDKDHFK